LFFAAGFLVLAGCSEPQLKQLRPEWPSTTRETKPWTRWWWHGSALTRQGITSEMEAYQAAGIGGLEITPIYGVFGIEDQFIDYLSPQWMELLQHTLKEAERLDMGVDMATGTGWPFGGPWVTDEDASKNLHHLEFSLSQGQRLKEPITFIQQPYLRAVGSQLYEVHDSFSTEKIVAQGTRSEPVMRIDPKTIDITQLTQPISSNKNLQALAIDQVVFERSLPLELLMAYSDVGDVLNLTDKVDKKGILDWEAPAGNWKLYAIFQGWHGKMVERAGPGGEGYVIDHFSTSALSHYLNRFDSAFEGHDIHTLRAFFNDSYEVDDARGAADWTPEFLDAFRQRRGYDLEKNLPALFGNDTSDKNKRVLCDYRETVSELVLHNFTQPWKKWAEGKSAIIRNQAHGSPSNILDLYATVDIPEIEGVEALRIKMASSAGNVTGKKLVSSESATWLNEHFESNLADIKVALDRFMLNGVNHLFYHGTSYSPPDDAWPGRLFYAAVHLNPRNSLWKDVGVLNAYATRCQSFLQDSQADNDILLYFPIYDRFSTPGNEMIEHFDGIGRQFEGTAFARGAEQMLKRGFTFDYISDLQIANSQTEGGNIKTASGSLYKVLVVPHCQFIPVNTLTKIMALARQGAAIVFLEGLPDAPSGYSNYDENRRTFEETLKKIENRSVVTPGVQMVKAGAGNVFVGDSLELLLARMSVPRESMVDSQIQFIRKKRDGNRTLYFISNSGDQPFEGWLPLTAAASAAILFDPMHGDFGAAGIRSGREGATEVYLQLHQQETLIIETYEERIEMLVVPFYKDAGDPVMLSEKWTVRFHDGGPTLPPVYETDVLTSWTNFGLPEHQTFSGTATYGISFDKPGQHPQRWLLDLGQVKETAEVFLNGNLLGTLIGPTYQLDFDPALLQEKNHLEVKVSNRMANRIADLDRRNVFWKKFYNVNFPARKSENRKDGLFDASKWKPVDSGLLGPVKLVPLNLVDVADR